jgi:hypothetical protein
MSLKLVAVGPPSAGNSSFLSPSAVLISGSGARAYWRARAALSTDTGISGLGNQFEGRITGIDWNGSSWTVFPGQSGQTGGAEIYNEGNNFLGISKNGNRVAWNFRYHSPDTTQRGGIDTRNYQTQQSQRFYEFIPANQSAPNYSLGTELTPFVNVPNGVNVIYTPSSLRFSDDGQLTFILFQSGDNLIEVTGRPSLFFQNDGAYGNNLQNFEISGNGSSVFIFIGGSIKEFNWNGSSWQFANNILNTGPAFFPNFDGTILAAQTSDNSAVRVFKKTGVKFFANPAWFEFGIKRHLITSKKVLTNGSVPFGRMVIHPGMSSKNFLRNTVQENISEIRAAQEASLGELTRLVVRSGAIIPPDYDGEIDEDD